MKKRIFAAWLIVVVSLSTIAAQQDEPKKPGGLRGLLGRVGEKVKEKTGTGKADEPKASNGSLNGRATVKQTELAAFFAKHPQPGAGKVELWPRVAITMVSAPSWHLDRPDPANTSPYLAQDGCWEFTAKVWDSATQSRDVPSFFKCTDEGITVLGGSIRERSAFGVWSGLTLPVQPGLQIASPMGSTGAQRTLGPVPPDSGLPSSVAYRRAVFHQTYSGYVIREIVNATDLDYAAGDKRLWVNLAPEVEAAVLAR